uniref:Uncharacterized protein n=1 Tax=Glycine max TaxID=3847 RepID=A0A0R0KDF9_SOYBN
MPKPMRMEEKIKYFMQVTDAPWSVAVRKLQKHGGNLSKALEDLHNHIHITIHMPGGGCLRCIFVKSDNLQDVYGYLWQLGLGEYASESYRLVSASFPIHMISVNGETQFPGRCYSIEDGWLLGKRASGAYFNCNLNIYNKVIVQTTSGRSSMD